MVKKSAKKESSKTEKLLVSKKEVKEDLEKVKAKKVEEDDQPSWYHYVIVLLIFASIFGLFYFGYYLYDLNNEEAVNPGKVLYHYPHVVGNITYNIYFSSPVEDVEEFNFSVEPNKIDVLNTVSYKMSFLEYNGTDNGEVARASSKFVTFLKVVYRFKFDQDSFVMYNETNCDNSTKRDKVIVFNPYANETGIFIDDNGCIEFLSDDPKRMVDLVDKFMYNLLNE